MEAETLYELLERQVIPEFHARDEHGIPAAWVARMRESMARLTPQFSANRSVREYAEQHYLPAAEGYRARAAGKGALGRSLVDGRRRLEQGWAGLAFGPVRVETRDGQHFIEVQVRLGPLDPESVRIELYAMGVGDGPPERQEMRRAGLPPSPDGLLYRAAVPAVRPAGDYTARAMARAAAATLPLEDPLIRWQR